MSTLICAETLWSCGLACVEAILADNGIQNNQSKMLASLAHLFPDWATQPGLMSSADFEVVFREIGFPVTIVRPARFSQAIAELGHKNTVGGVIWVTKFWDNPVIKNTLVDLNHALRLVGANQNGVEVMNPYRCPSPARDEFYTWPEIDSFKSGVLIFRK